MKRLLSVILVSSFPLVGCSEGFVVPGSGPSWDSATVQEADSAMREPKPEEVALSPTWVVPLAGSGAVRVSPVESGVVLLSAPNGATTLSEFGEDGDVRWTTEVGELGASAVLGGSPNGAPVLAGSVVEERGRVDVVRFDSGGERMWTTSLPEYSARLTVVSVTAIDEGVVAVLSEAVENAQQIGVLDFIGADGVHRARETVASETMRPVAVLGSEDELTMFSEYPEEHPEDGDRLSTHVRIYAADGLLLTAGPRAIEFTGAWAAEEGALMGGIVDANLSCVVDAHPYRTSDASMKESPFPIPVASLDDWIVALDDGDVLLGRDGGTTHRFESDVPVIQATRAFGLEGVVFAVAAADEGENAQLLRLDLP